MNSSLLYVTPPGGATLASAAGCAGVLATGSPTGVAGTAIVAVPVAGLARGRCRLVLKFSDGTEAVAHYYVLP